MKISSDGVRLYFETVFSSLLLLAIAAGILSTSCTLQKRSSDQPVPTGKDTMVIKNTWARPASRGMTGGIYLSIYNGTSESDTLTGVSTDVAEHAEIHESFQKENGVSGMQPAGELPIDAGTRLELKPGGYHIMLMQLRRDLTVGDSISLTLHFVKNDSIVTRIPVSQSR